MTPMLTAAPTGETRGAEAVPDRDAATSAAPGPDRAVLRLTVRLVRRGALLLALANAVYVAVEVFSYVLTYPDEASRARLATFQDNAAVRMLQGVPNAVDTPGGFVAWDAGWVLAGILALWVVLTTTRLLRGEDESGRAELLLLAACPSARITLLQLVTVQAAVGLSGLAVGATLVASGTPVAGAALFAGGLTSFGWLFAAAAGVASQLVDVRRRATGVTMGLFAGFFLLRMVANSGDSTARLRWLTPLGWLDELQPYGGNRWPVLALPLLAAGGLTWTTVLLRRRRDAGGAVLQLRERRRRSGRGLARPDAFALRCARPVLLAWVAGVGAYCFMIGAVVKSATEFLAEDEQYRKTMEALGLDVAETARGFVGFMSVMIGLLVAIYVGFRHGTTREEEASGRAEHLLVRPVSRVRWLSGHAVVTALGAGVLTLTAGVSIWGGAALTGADVSLGDALRSALNTLPLAGLFIGVGLLVLGLVPRLTVAVGVALPVVSYLLEFVGTSLDWPGWVLSLSPFHHLAFVPAEPFDVTGGLGMTLLGLAAAVAGVVAFTRRDITGG